MPVSENRENASKQASYPLLLQLINTFDTVRKIIECYAMRGVSYVGEGELSRFCKIAHNVLLGVYIQNLAEITILAQSAGVP